MGKNHPLNIIYTYTDEAPALATASLLPIIESFLSVAGVSVKTFNISLAARIMAAFNDKLPEDMRVFDALTELKHMVQEDGSNIIKLPNISASLSQLKEAIMELRAQGVPIPDYPKDGDGREESLEVKRIYDQVKGSAVNPVIREGNSDRRIPESIKRYAQEFPHPMGEWEPTSKTHVSSMKTGDFYSNEASKAIRKDCKLEITFKSDMDCSTTSLGEIIVGAGTIVDATYMSAEALCEFYEEQIFDAKDNDLLFSIHLKATMMKASDPIIFGHCIRVLLKPAFDKYSEELEGLGVKPSNGLGAMLDAISTLPSPKANEIKLSIESALADCPDLAMVDSDKGITNLHVPSDIIVDASMPSMIRSSGKMWNSSGKLQDTKAVIPDQTYSGIYQTVIEDCKQNGKLDPATIGTVSNVGLMAGKAEEYGSHDKTFEISENGVVSVEIADGQTLFEHKVSRGDIWRMCLTREEAIKDWVDMAVKRGNLTGDPIIFWLDENRAHDNNIISKIRRRLGETSESISSLKIHVFPPAEACKKSLEIIRSGKNVISATGNVLRDYNTDLFPILEVGTSAKMLSVVPLLAGGGLFETGAGGTAPKHVQQFVKENHLRWDSLGEFLALLASLEYLYEKQGGAEIKIFADSLSSAIEKWLKDGRSPGRKVGETDNRVSHYFLAKYWAHELAKQNEDKEIADHFESLYKNLSEGENAILSEFSESVGMPVKIGGYYRPDPDLVKVAMRPSPTFNSEITMRKNVDC